MEMRHRESNRLTIARCVVSRIPGTWYEDRSVLECAVEWYSWHIPRVGIPASYSFDPAGFILRSAWRRRGFTRCCRDAAVRPLQWIRGWLVRESHEDRARDVSAEITIDRSIQRTNLQPRTQPVASRALSSRSRNSNSTHDFRFRACLHTK